MTALGDQARLLRRMVWRYVDGLTDDELHWEPVVGMWGLRRKSELRTPLEDGAAPGDWWIDTLAVEDDLAPLTTIGWRIAHLTLGTFNWNHIIEGVPVPAEPSLCGHAAGAIDLWRGVLDRFVELVGGFDDDALATATDAWGGEEARSLLVSHVTLEIALHSSEIGTLRHLHRVTHGG